jgi:hypothetical protein
MVRSLFLPGFPLWDAGRLKSDTSGQAGIKKPGAEQGCSVSGVFPK